MKIGLKRGDKGAEVKRLHNILNVAGLHVEPGEIERGEFGPSTFEALRLLRRQHGLPECDEIDDSTQAVLLDIEQNISININESTSPAQPPAQNQHHGIVQGKLVDEDGTPMTGTRVSLFAKQIRSEMHLGDATTGKQGQYSISYHRPRALNLVVRAYDASGTVIVESPTVFAAAAQVQINLTTAASGIIRPTSIFTNIETAVAAQLQDTPLSDLKENKDTHELQFLASAASVQFDDVACLFIASLLGTKNNIRAATFFGIFYQGVPASLDAALASLPDAGIDGAFTAQVLSGVVAHSRDSLSQVLTASVKANILPASYAAAQDSELGLLDDLRTQSVGNTPYIRGKTSLNDLLAAGGVASAAQTAFKQAYADNGGQLEPALTTLGANKSLSAADLANLETTLSVGELLAGNLPLVKDTLSRLSAATLTSVQDLALLDASDWVARITAIDPNATSIPPVLPNETPQQRIARFAKALAARFASRYPGTAFAGGLSKAQTSSFEKTKVELVTFLTANPTLNIKNTNIDQFIATNKAAISAPALADLKTAQRLFRISPHYATVEALKSAGYQSAQSVYFKGRDVFLAEMTPALGSASLAKMAYARAQMTYATALTAYSRYNLALNGISVAALGSQAPDPSALTSFPDLQALFGSLDYFRCEDCQSVYSPAAYLVDLLQYLAQFQVTIIGTPITSASNTAPIVIITATPHGLQTGVEVSISGALGNTAANGTFTITVTNPTSFTLNGSAGSGAWTRGGIVTITITNARDALFLRRPEIQYIALDCNNTNVTLPYIDLVNEIFEAAIIAPPATPVTLIDTIGTSAERRALPQQISQQAYVLTASAVFPLSLPFDLAFAQTTAYINALGTTRVAILKLFAGSPIGPSAAAIAGASLGINPEMQAVINGMDNLTHAHQDWDRWGLAQNPASVIDPETRAPYSPNPADWIAAMSYVPVFLNRAGLSLQQLYQLLEVVWVTQAGVTLSAGTTISGGLPILSPDLDLMVFTGLTADINDNCAVLDRANRFLRLWTASGLQMWELDWALEAAVEGALNDKFLVFLSGAIAVQTQLNLPFQEVLSFWMPLETRDVTNHLGDEDTVVPSTYSEVFRNAAVLASAASVFVPVNPNTITAASNGPDIAITTAEPHGYQTNMQVSIAGVIGNTAANGKFTITVTSPTSFTLNGSNGNGVWTSGGVATRMLPGNTIVPDSQNAITASLALGASDISAILAFTDTANVLSLATLNVLLQFQRLSTSLSLDVADLIEWIQLTSGKPFNGAPADTLEFLRRLGVVQGTGIAVHDIDYLLRNQSASQSSLAFTAIQATAVLQTVRDAVAKLRGAIVIPVAAASNAHPIAISTASPHGLPTGAQVSISGVSGNTAANGTFTITVTSSTSFTLDGPSGNGAWTGGGTIGFLATPPIPITAASNSTLIAITTASPHGQQTGARVSISGASGNTAANGTFTITVTSSTSFTLDGSTGNGAWTGGGTVAFLIATADPATIQTIFVNALATATATTANVVTPVLLKKGVLPLDSQSITLLLAQSSSVDGTQFPALINAFTSVAKAAALFTALKPTESEFAFVVQNSGVFNWLDPSALPLVPTNVSPYSQFEALLRALKLDQRQSARTPKLFDILGQWLPPNPLPTHLPSAIGGPAIKIIGATTGTPPIAITTASQHGLQTGTQVTISGVVGNAAANGSFIITVTGPTKFTLNGSIGSGAWVSGGTVVVPYLAFALNAGVSDVIAIATELHAAPPSLTAATQSGSLADMAMLSSIASALDVAALYGISGATLVQLAAAPATADTASAAMGALQAQYAQSAWFGAIQPVEDALRQNRRDALVAYMLGPGPTAPTIPLLTTDDIFNYYLIDPEMCPCALMTRLLQASLAIQQFMQQCFLNLFFFAPPGVSVTMSNAQLCGEWSWRQQYRLWQANREVFLYPENYVLPELRTNASSFFTDLENDLRQTNCDADAAEAALENYLRKLVSVARLHVAGHYNQTNLDGSTVLHVFAHTRGTPPQWYYRTLTSMTTGPGSWSAWESLNLDIASQHLVPVVWDQRLHLIWPIFKQISEKQGDQTLPALPSSGPHTQSAPQKCWTVEFAMSELSAGQWQAKRTIAEKAFLNTEDPPLAFTFAAAQVSFNLQLQIYYATFEEIGGQDSAQQEDMIELSSTAPVPLAMWEPQNLVANATLPMPDSPLSVVESWDMNPGIQYVDLSQEPTFALVNWSSMSGQLSTPSLYSFSGQDLVYGNYTTPNPAGQQILTVQCETNSAGQIVTIPLLGTMTNPRIVVPQQELPLWDSANPFFVADPTRTYLVLPQYYNFFGSQLQQWQTQYVFQTFYHPYARTFLRELEIGGVPQLMARNLQVNPQTVRGWGTPNFDFNAIYAPNSQYVAQLYPGAPEAPDPGESALDFAAGSSGAYSLYNWELFYHVPMFVVSLLLQNQQFQDALTWLEYIFNPTDSSGGPSPQRFWQMAPFNAMNMTGPTGWTSQQIQNILTTGINDPATLAAIQIYMLDPFDPHAIASLRIAAYGKATVMKFLDVLIAWGDWYYSQYTAEMVSQAEQLYILADMLLGPQPQMLRLPDSSQGGAGTATYASLKNVDAFSNVLVNIENVIVAPEPPQAIVQGTAQTPSLPQLPGNGSTLLFCIPPNDQLLAYWGTVSQRLYNIRNCLNLQGVPQPLPLYAPPINPLLLVEAAASGSSFSGATPAAPIYRLAIYLQKAIELTNDVRSYGALILSALEKQDAETLAVLRANQELDIQTRMLDVKTMQITEAQDQITALQNQQAVVKIRINFYSTVAFMNPSETGALALQQAALALNLLALPLDAVAGVSHLIPSFSIGVAGFGGTPNLSVSMGGSNFASSASAFASGLRGFAGTYGESASMSATMGGYQRRQDEWTLQLNLANAELIQVASQITAATDRLNIANKELDIQNAQISNAQAVSDFLTNKYTNAQLYNWMITQLTTVYTQAYQLAFSLALQAQNAYQYELGSQDTFIQFGYWDSQHKGLTAGESLLFDLRRMEAQYLAENSRELELTKHISLALTQPLELVMVRETGACQIALDEVLFESDYPGQYFRRLRSVALTIPCVTGPYTGVHATLSLTGSMLRIQAPGSTYTPQSATQLPVDPTVIGSPLAAPGTQTIATSSGQNDAGLFDVNLHDERWLPFEGQGAISTWNLGVDPRENNFDFTTITDVVLHIRYTARGGGDQTAANNVRNALAKVVKPYPNPGLILVSVRNTFGGNYYTFFNPPDPASTELTLTLPLTNVVFPFSNLGKGVVSIEKITFYVILSVPASGNNISASFNVTGGTLTPGSLLPFAPAPFQTSAGDPIAALTASATPAVPAPQSFTLTVPVANVPSGLGITVNGQTRLDPSKIQDILLIVTYSIN